LEIPNNSKYLRVKEHETRTGFEYGTINDVKKIFSATEEFEFVEYL
jgi:hypothetical protein